MRLSANPFLRFNDIASARWFYSNYPEHFFDGMACLSKRDANQLEERVKYFKPSPDMSKGFEKVLDIEKTENPTRRSKYQLEHLLAIADHEQREILQPLIYNDPVFKKWLIRERKYWRWVAPTYQLVFTHQCSDSDPQLKSVAPGDMKVEEEESRMDWIADAAEKFHDLMNDQETHMLNDLRIMAAWVNSPDARFVY